MPIVTSRAGIAFQAFACEDRDRRRDTRLLPIAAVFAWEEGWQIHNSRFRPTMLLVHT